MSRDQHTVQNSNIKRSGKSLESVGRLGYLGDNHNRSQIFLISNFLSVVNFVCFLLGDSPASELRMPNFRNNLSFPSS